MKIMVIGTRGVPNILGGVETHCEELYPKLVGDNEIVVIGRSCYVMDKSVSFFKGVRLKTIYAPKAKALEAIVHSLLCVLYAGIKRPDVLHIHAIGPNLVAPIARLLGLKVVMTHHGPDYERKKWGKAAKFFLKAGEKMGIKFANKVIVISEEIKNSIASKYGREDSILIPNGVSIKERPLFKTCVIEKFGIARNSYIFTLGRFVPEKGFDYLIRSYQKSGLSNRYRLVIAGDADHETDYSRSLKQQAYDANVILTGFIKGEELAQLFSNCALFILPSYYEGLPISLLEGMAYGLPILVSDISANKQVKLPMENYFSVGNEDALAAKMNEFLPVDYEPQIEIYDMKKYDWETIAFDTNEVYKEV